MILAVVVVHSSCSIDSFSYLGYYDCYRNQCVFDECCVNCFFLT